MTNGQKFRNQYDGLRGLGHGHCEALKLMAKFFLLAKGSRQQWLRGIVDAKLPRGTARSMWHEVKRETKV